ncbi:MAG TPA: hypothetical protein VH481_01610 [Nitrososphaeraceae archaeon]|jgi:hypothetical protein
MAENKFVSGNVIVVYCNFVELESDESLPQHVLERIKVCSKIYERIMKSKPDKSNTIIEVVSDSKTGNLVKNNLLAEGVEESKIIIENSFNSIGRLFSILIEDIKKRPNPPVIYFISSYQQKDIFDLATERYKEYKIQFEGALDKRPEAKIKEDRKREKVNKRYTNVKEKGKNKVVDLLLNYIFPESKK